MSQNITQFPLNSLHELGFTGSKNVDNHVDRSHRIGRVKTTDNCFDIFERMALNQETCLVIYKKSKPIGVLSATDIDVWLNSTKTGCDLLELPVSYYHNT
eukprot:UN02239